MPGLRRRLPSLAELIESGKVLALNMRAGSAALVFGSRLEYLASLWRVILADHGLAISLHLGLVLGAVAAA